MAGGDTTRALAPLRVNGNAVDRGVQHMIVETVAVVGDEYIEPLHIGFQCRALIHAGIRVDTEPCDNASLDIFKRE